MQLGNKKRIRFIINPISGTRDKLFIESYIIKYINHNLFIFDIEFTEYAHHATKLAKDAAQKDYDVVVAIGGDGSINEVASGLVNSNTALAIIPNGSGNGMAHYLKIPLNVQKAIEIINNLYITPIDTATINDKLFVSIAGLGFDALVADNFAQSKTRGFFSYFRIIIKNYFTYRRKSYLLYVGDKKFKKKAMMISLANSNQFGYNTTIAPNAVINDGLLDVCIIHRIPFLEVGLLSLLLFLKRIDISNHVEIIKCKEMTILQNKKRVIHIDGDPLTFEKRLHIKVNPLSLKVVVPEKTFNQLSKNIPAE